MVVLFVLGGVGVARPSLLEPLPDLDWDARRIVEIVGRLVAAASQQDEPAAP